MKEPVFVDKPGFCQQLSIESAVFMEMPIFVNKPTDGAFEATCHPRLGGASEGGGVAGMHRLSVCYIKDTTLYALL